MKKLFAVLALISFSLLGILGIVTYAAPNPDPGTLKVALLPDENASIVSGNNKLNLFAQSFFKIHL